MRATTPSAVDCFGGPLADWEILGKRHAICFPHLCPIRAQYCAGHDWRGDMLKCNACGAISGDVRILEAEGGPVPDRAVIAVRIKICDSCYSRPERSQLLSRLCADILVPPSYWFGRNIAWSSAIRMVRSPRGQRAPRFWYEPEAHPLGYWSQARPALANGGSSHASCARLQ